MENTPNTLKMGKDWSSCQELEILFGLYGPKLFILGIQLVILQVGVSLIPTDAGQTCSSCSGVDEREGCQHQVVCNNTEECYIHKYTTESGQELSDLGCTLPQACPSVIAPILGKRAEGHHFRCMACCNNTAICNQNLTCGGTTVADAKLPRDCSELVLPYQQNGSYIIFPFGEQHFPASVRCEFIGQDSWTVIQRRFDGSVFFNRSWGTYKAGFGRSNGEYWLGNDFINILTNDGVYNLRVIVEDWQHTSRYADYRAFRIGDEDHDYYLSIWGYSGNAGLQLVILQVGMSLIPTDAGQTCSSCSGVGEREGCQHQVVCNNTEACYVHKYTTESGQELSDHGCTLPQACPSVIAPILGKRAEGRHFKCMACCNNTAICNQNLTCGGTTVADAKLPRDCSELVLPVKRNGSYVIFPYGVQQVPASVRCEFIGQDAWTVIQRRYDGSVNFTRSWDIYKSGFGRSDGEYWLGNDFIHILTSNGLNNLRVSLKDWQDMTVHADYRAFRIGDEDHDYYLSIWGYSGNAGDSMLYHDGMKFSTIDEDNDENVDDYQHSSQYYTSGKCAVWYGAGWWFKNCFQANLNGKYLRNSRSTEENGIHWNSFHPKNYSLKASTMMIKKS